MTTFISVQFKTERWLQLLFFDIAVHWSLDLELLFIAAASSTFQAETIKWSGKNIWMVIPHQKENWMGMRLRYFALRIIPPGQFQ